MKNFKVMLSTNRKNCPLKYKPSCTRIRPLCTGNDLKPCTEKNCPFKEKPKCA